MRCGRKLLRNSSRSFISILWRRSLRLQPAGTVVLGFVYIERSGVPQREADIVEPFEQAELAEGIDLKLCFESATVRHGLRFERNRELIAGNLLCVLKQRFDLRVAEPRENDAVLAGIREKDVGECRRDDHTEAVVRERPCGMLAARSAAEVPAGNENPRAVITRVIQHEVSDWRAVGRLPPVKEEKIAVAGALDALQKLLGNDLVGVDVGAIERRGQRGECLEGFH